jgi:O-antigen ligase
VIGILLVYLLAIAPASLLAVTLAPSATVLNQLLALSGWGLAAIWIAWLPTTEREARGRSDAALVLSLATCGVAAILAPFSFAAPVPIESSMAAILFAAWAVMRTGLRVAGEEADAARLGIASVFAFIGCANALIAVLQVFLPQLTDGSLIARSGLVGRAVGNLRQPNHLSTLALWSAVWVAPLTEGFARQWRGVLALLFALFIFTVELSASRTGIIGVGVLALWGLLDRRLSRFTRLMLIAAPVIYAVGWIGMDFWAHHGHHTFGAEERLGQRDISSSRFAIWSETLKLIRANPWTGVGVNEFNFAWTLTPFPGRPPEFFDHCHNIVLEMLVELGIPLGTLVVVLLAVALWQAFRRAWAVPGPQGVGFRAAFMMVLLVAIHSQLEYPLWYAYFLLPTAWAWGYCLGAPSEKHAAALSSLAAEEAAGGDVSRAVGATARGGRAFFITAGLLMILGSAWAFQQYLTVSRIFEPGDDDRPLSERIAEGQKTLFYAHHADYAAVTVAEHPADEWKSFQVATHYLLDTRLMIAWATAFAERGDIDRARYIAARLREFNKPEADEFFAPCQHPQAGKPLPFQCEPPQHSHDWREFRDPALYR